MLKVGVFRAPSARGEISGLHSALAFLNHVVGQDSCACMKTGRCGVVSPFAVHALVEFVVSKFDSCYTHGPTRSRSVVRLWLQTKKQIALYGAKWDA